jgi:putative tryptophan/tyrosine transport system substrate-binding protein
MRRREFITLLGGAAAWPLTAHAQPRERVKRVGVFFGTDAGGAPFDPLADSRLVAFREELQKLGWIEGRNIRLEYRASSNDPKQIDAVAKELVALQPDMIISSAVGTGHLHRATSTVPIVSVGVPDLVAAGYVESLARPGGNITGVAYFDLSVMSKRLQLLKDIAPRVSHVTLIYDPANPAWTGLLAELEAAAPSFGVRVRAVAVRNAGEIEEALQRLGGEPNGGLMMAGGPATNQNAELICTLATRHGIPGVYSFRFFVTSGGLVSYGVDFVEPYRRAATYVDRILKGERAADLPVQQATKFELAINLKTAKTLNVTIPPGILAVADEVIE